MSQLCKMRFYCQSVTAASIPGHLVILLVEV